MYDGAQGDLPQYRTIAQQVGTAMLPTISVEINAITSFEQSKELYPDCHLAIRILHQWGHLIAKFELPQANFCASLASSPDHTPLLKE